jgi:hypothetical protein
MICAREEKVVPILKPKPIAYDPPPPPVKYKVSEKEEKKNLINKFFQEVRNGSIKEIESLLGVSLKIWIS